MRSTLVTGVLLVVLGVAALAYQSITYTKRETVVDIGPLHATADRKKTVPLPPIIGIVAIGAGAALIIGSVRKRT